MRFVIRAARVEVPHTDDHAADAIAGTAALHAQFEAFIRQAPEQWMWDPGNGSKPTCGRRSLGPVSEAP